MALHRPNLFNDTFLVYAEMTDIKDEEYSK
jgi:hypothetical protein